MTKKAVFLSIVSFLLGAGMVVVVLANPFRWEWMSRTGLSLSGRGEAEVLPEANGDQLWTCGMHPQVIQDEPGTCPICGMNLVPMNVDDPPKRSGTKTPDGEKKILYWRAPMDPTYISDKPGKSPMGMDLIPVYEGEEEETPPGLVRINPAFVQNMGVQTEIVERRDIPFIIRTVGQLTYDDSQISWVNTKYEGWIERVFVNYVGEPVQKGQKLFEIYSPQLVTTQNEYLQALEYAERMKDADYPEITARAEALLSSSRQRLRYWDISDEQLDALEASREPRKTLTVVSPVNGLIVEKMNQALEGMYVKPGMNLYQIVDLSKIWVEVEVFENQVPWLKPGSKATIEVPYEPGVQYTGRVRYVYPFINEKTRTMKVSIELPNPGQKFRAEMYANVTFEVPAVEDVVAVPDTAVIHSGTRKLVVLSLGEGLFQVRELVLGVNDGGVWEVKRGLREGERIVVSAQFLIDSESNLKEAIRKMVGGTTEDVVTPAPTEHAH